MGNRTLIEINHDKWYNIDKNPEDFVDQLILYLGTGDSSSTEALEYYGVHVIGTKHHSDGHDITWGDVKEELKR